uniref:UBA domain-containing protein n=1 Tax=Fagus sylvatica TaxID=28930 RepID=A0A2N9HXS2_FAGSY
MPVPKVNTKLLEELEDMGFPRPRATRALHYSGNSSLEAAINWVIDHENDSDIDQMPLISVEIDLDSPQPFHITEQMKIKAQELRLSLLFLASWFLFMTTDVADRFRDQARKKREEEEKKLERQREKERIHDSKILNEVKRNAEENERKRYLALKKAEREEVKRAREKILKKLEHDKVERKSRLGFPPEGPSSIKPSTHLLEEKKLQTSLPVKSITKAEQMRECLRSLKRNHQNDGARVRTAFQTLLIYVGNVAKNPDDEKFRKIRLSNPLFQDRVGNLRGGVEFLELCGFERTEGDEFLYLPRDKVDMALLNTSGSQLNSAMTNPFFGLLSG